jgi:hypothetical protein
VAVQRRPADGDGRVLHSRAVPSAKAPVPALGDPAKHMNEMDIPDFAAGLRRTRDRR